MFLVTAGAFAGAGCLVLGVTELASIRSIRPPAEQTFSRIRGTTLQYQTVFLPAVGALISGLFVSLSASFFYAGVTGQSEPWQEMVGLALFVVAFVALVITLRSALKNAGDPADMARDPFTIRAAADEYASAPRRALLEPGLLRSQLEEWEGNIVARSLGLAGSAQSPLLRRHLDAAAAANGVGAALPLSLKLYFAACRRFPIRLGWSVIGGGAFVVGAVLVVIAELDAGWMASWRTWAGLAVLALISGAVMALVVAFYGWARGNRARLWHAIYLRALLDARRAVGRADAAYVDLGRDRARTLRILDRADAFFETLEPRDRVEPRVLLQVGPFQLVLVEKDEDTASPGR